MLVNLNATLLSDDMTNEDWQKYFLEMKKVVKKSKRKKMATDNRKTIFSDSRHTGLYTDYYAIFINEILSSIRHGNVDNCYYIYQIATLLEYEPEIITYWNKEKRMFDVYLPSQYDGEVDVR